MKNGSIKDIEKKLLSDNWYTLNKYTFKYQRPDGSWETQHREAYDRGNGAAILLYNSKKGTVVLTRQFRMPTYVNGNENGMMIEVCAGLLDGDNPADCVRKETEEETGYKISNVQKVFQTYMSPGSVTEILYLFVGEYDESMKVSNGGGAEDETENIEVLELNFIDAMKMVASGEIKDAKTIMLLQHAKLNALV
ncbi:GDP-mannose pyrophosphatase NudK [Maribacter hydrothermalis]|uniref:GDP-mannose pyrophosphatase n=1 Tax=Maribacter hydrothermalis TaxID=1836467 RepID=A0A1B7ZCD0_9FLAO|nr:GDP-mannose pyrophosphatase NudK [Maribacter hydrothermalis]APQ16006.1 GDP-mannose pyrophosphatase NudK [Maribacter hydrothermalis]OBR40423.1 GDP-mannose pyrophosphatase [Maribacter hydrothermalis]